MIIGGEQTPRRLPLPMKKLQFQSDGPLWAQVIKKANELLKPESLPDSQENQMHYFKVNEEWELMKKAAESLYELSVTNVDKSLHRNLQILHHWCQAHGVTSTEKAFKATWSHEKILRLAIIGEMRKFVENQLCNIQPKENLTLALLDGRINFYKYIHNLDIKKGAAGDNELQCLLGIERELNNIREICQSIRDSLRCAELYDRIAVKFEHLAHQTQQLMFATREIRPPHGNYNEIQERRSKDGVGALAILSYSLGKRPLEVTSDTTEFLNFSSGFLPLSNSKLWSIGSEDSVEDKAFKFAATQRRPRIALVGKLHQRGDNEHMQLCLLSSHTWNPFAPSAVYRREIVLLATNLVPQMLKTFNAAKTMKISKILVSYGGEKILGEYDIDASKILKAATDDLKAFKMFCVKSIHSFDKKRHSQGFMKTATHLSKLSKKLEDIVFYIQELIEEIEKLQRTIEQVTKVGDEEYNWEKKKLFHCLKLRDDLAEIGNGPVNRVITLNKSLSAPPVHHA
ncbi:hypothetical protein BCR33DRAFT_847165 [Rhizoclosmatium globosum]|uniref:Uncharacterized protein n=1 Tax=Rhizoclosmatium globosum TaxID=329046 RepID=A0A1Y2CS93_9FUNG|nr:hypothetical protein BCR33DRAFT_847165 [Rhizoclosmatium globosum]|eukprot:ORY49908.1 hypothetical protein BCR33DRAFT_847165 [Rhizoclosmatium globosum]